MSMSFESARIDALVESARLLQAAPDVDQLLAHLLRAAMAHTLTSRGFAAFDDGEGMRVRHSRGIPAAVVGNGYDEPAFAAAGIRTTLPLGQPDSPCGLLGVGASPQQNSEEQEEFLAALVGIAAGAIENVRFRHDLERLNQKLDRRVHDLRTLLDLVRDFTAVTDPEAIARMLALTLAGQWAVQRYFVAAWREGQPDVSRASRGLTVPHDELRAALSGGGDWLEVERLEQAPLRDLLVQQRIVALIPIRAGSEVIGVVGLGSKPAGDYGADDLEYTRGLVDQAAVALENAWNFRETLEKKRIEKELELAADIQRRLLPASLPQRPRIEVAASTRPARHVGGDYYDVVDLADGTQLYCVADVSGKGVAASLLMSNFQASLRALASASLPLPEMVARMNTLMHASTASNKYVTAIFAAIDPESGECRFVNAGHNDGVILRSSGEVERIKAAGLAVGLLPARTYGEMQTTLGPGDLVALYSDGVTEANDPNENEFEIERLIELLREKRDQGIEPLVGDVFTAVDTFADTAPQYDDITIMILRRREAKAALQEGEAAKA